MWFVNNVVVITSENIMITRHACLTFSIWSITPNTEHALSFVLTGSLQNFLLICVFCLCLRRRVLWKLVHSPNRWLNLNGNCTERDATFNIRSILSEGKKRTGHVVQRLVGRLRYYQPSLIIIKRPSVTFFRAWRPTCNNSPSRNYPL